MLWISSTAMFVARSMCPNFSLVQVTFVSPLFFFVILFRILVHIVINFSEYAIALNCKMEINKNRLV